jgi:hypothetical protein
MLPPLTCADPSPWGSMDVRRRDFLGLVGGSAATWLLAARAQRRPPMIGYLGATTQGAERQRVASLVRQLGELGWIEGASLASKANNRAGMVQKRQSKTATISNQVRMLRSAATSNKIIQKGLAFRRTWSGTVADRGPREGARDPAPPASAPRWGFGGAADRVAQPNRGSLCQSLRRSRSHPVRRRCLQVPQSHRPRIASSQWVGSPTGPQSNPASLRCCSRLTAARLMQ